MGGLPFPPPGDLPDPGIEAKSFMSLTLAGGFFTTEPPGKYIKNYSDGQLGTIETEAFRMVILRDQ